MIMKFERILRNPECDTIVFVDENDYRRYIELYNNMAIESHIVSSWSKGSSSWTIWRNPEKINLIRNGIIPKRDDTTWDKPSPILMNRAKIGSYVLNGTLTEACKELARAKLLKGHTLINCDNKTIIITKTNYCSDRELVEKKYDDDAHLICVFSEAEAYWQPEYIKVFYNTKNQNYEFWLMPRDRHGYKIIENLTFQQVWQKARNWIDWNLKSYGFIQFKNWCL